jgi:hypothetical protein
MEPVLVQKLLNKFAVRKTGAERVLGPQARKFAWRRGLHAVRHADFAGR